jgi:hypothetical protein
MTSCNYNQDSYFLLLPREVFLLFPHQKGKAHLEEQKRLELKKWTHYDGNVDRLRSGLHV